MKNNIQQLFQEFLTEYTFIKRLCPQTIRGYKQTFNTLFKLIPSISLNSLSPETITRFFKLLTERKRIVWKGTVKEGIKDSTTATYWTKLNSFCEWLFLRGHIQDNPCRAMRFRAPTYEDIQFLSKAQIEKIISAIHLNGYKNALVYKRNLAMMYIFLFCGLRREEALSLQIRDIDLEKGVLTVRGETSKSKRMRQVPLHSTVIHYLCEYLKERKDYTTQYLFVSLKKDQKLSLDGLKHIVTTLRAQSKIAFHIHQFRHTFAVNFLKSSNNIAKLKQLLGHQDIRMTLTYLRCLPVDTMREDIELMSIDTLL